MLDKVYREHISELPKLKTPLTNDYINDVLGMIEKQQVIDYIVNKGSETFNKDYAEKLCHLLLIGKLKITNIRTWLDEKSVHKSVTINAYNVYLNGVYGKSNINKKPLTVFFTELIQEYIKLIKEDKYCNIEINNLLEVLAIYYRQIQEARHLSGQLNISDSFKDYYITHNTSIFLDTLATPLNEKNDVSINITDRSVSSFSEIDCYTVSKSDIFNDYVLMIGKFIDCYNRLDNTDNISRNLPTVNLKLLREDGRSPLTKLFKDVYGGNINLVYTSNFEKTASEVILDISKLSEYNVGKNDIESSLRDLYIDAQGLNQIKRNSLLENTSNTYNDYFLIVKVINVEKCYIDLVGKILEEETNRLTNSYMDKFKYEIEVAE